MAHQKSGKFNLESFNLDPEVKEIIRNEINRIGNRLDAEKNNCHQAATFGKDLLKEKHQLKTENDEYKLEINEYKTLIDKLQQEKHSLALKLKNINLNQTMDIDTLSEKLESVERENKKIRYEKAALEDNIQSIQKERHELEEKQQELINVLLLKEREIFDLRKELEQMKERENKSFLSDTTLGNDSNSDIEELRSKNGKIIRMYMIANDQLKEQSITIVDLNKQLEKLMNEVSDKDEEIKSYSSTARETKEQIEEYQEEIELLKMQQFDENKRGNCIFSEVEDHRKILEIKMTKVSEKNQFLSEKIDFLSKQNIKLKTQLNTLLCLKGQQVDRNRICELEGSLSLARTEIARLNHLLDSESKKNKETRKVNITVGEASCEPSNNISYNHLEVLLARSSLQLEEKNKVIDDFRDRYAQITEELISAQNQLYHSESHVESLKSEIMKLKNQIYSLKSSTTNIESAKPSFLVEKINIKQESVPTQTVVDRIRIGPSTKPTLKDTSNFPSQPKKDSPKIVNFNDSPNFIKPIEEVSSTHSRVNKPVPPFIKASEMDTIVEPDCKQQ